MEAEDPNTPQREGPMARGEVRPHQEERRQALAALQQPGAFPEGVTAEGPPATSRCFFVTTSTRSTKSAGS